MKADSPRDEVRILQFGEGNFLRCFIDWMVQKMNDRAGFAGKVRIVQPIGATPSAPTRILNGQGGFYHTCLRGMVDGKAVEILEENHAVESVLCAESQWDEVVASARLPSLRFVVSNTTEAGIEYRRGEDTFPRKVALFLKARFEAGLPGFVFLPCELIERNGEALRRCVLQYVADWGDDALAQWIARENVFCSTLVDRIVAGRPDAADAARYAAQLGARDDVLVCGEPFHFFAVETPAGFDLEAELPLRKAGVHVVYTRDLRPYRTRKVRFLNGAHTATIPEGLLAGFTEVAQLVADPHFNAHLRKILFEEIFPTVDLPEDEKRAYAASVLERFANPFAHHRLQSIALNSVSKWRVRVLPTVRDYVRLFGKVPENLTRSFAWLLMFYRTDRIDDSPEIKAYFGANPSPDDVMRRADLWGEDLTAIPGFAACVKACLG